MDIVAGGCWWAIVELLRGAVGVLPDTTECCEMLEGTDSQPSKCVCRARVVTTGAVESLARQAL